MENLAVIAETGTREREAAYVARVLGWAVPGGSVLDVGCGDGRRARALARAGFQVTALAAEAAGNDQAHEAVRRAGQEADGAPVRWAAAPDGSAEWPVAPVDAALCLDWPIGLPEAEQARLLRRLRDGLREGGVLLVGYAPGPLAAPTPGAAPADVRRRRLKELETRAAAMAQLLARVRLAEFTVVRVDADFTPERPASPASAVVHLVARPFVRHWIDP